MALVDFVVACARWALTDASDPPCGEDALVVISDNKCEAAPRVDPARELLSPARSIATNCVDERITLFPDAP
jgi:hypothetical protein